MVADSDEVGDCVPAARLPLVNRILASVEDLLRAIVRSLALVTAVATICAVMLHPGGSHWSTEKRIAVALSDLLMSFAIAGLGICFFVCLFIAAQPRFDRLRIDWSVYALIGAFLVNLLFVPRI
jgi:hypothetical protein